jgi:hypothetical protein
MTSSEFPWASRTFIDETGRVRADQLGAGLDQRRLQRSTVVGKVISCPSHPGEPSAMRRSWVGCVSIVVFFARVLRRRVEGAGRTTIAPSGSAVQ